MHEEPKKEKMKCFQCQQEKCFFLVSYFKYLKHIIKFTPAWLSYFTHPWTLVQTNAGLSLNTVKTNAI